VKIITVVGEESDSFKLSEDMGRDFFLVVNGNEAGDFLVISEDTFVSVFFLVLFLGQAVGNDGEKQVKCMRENC